ncbi:MAG: phage tail family protein [Clostridia bacterium]|nr:phage tail family protein [Clostridia bacterium]
MSYNFVFNGKHSLNDMGIYAEMKSRPLFAEPKTIYEDIAGTDGELNFNSANPKGRMCFKPRIIELECHFADGGESRADYINKASAIATWLATEDDKVLTFDDEPNIQYMAHAANLFNIENVTEFSGTFPLVFKCMPFRYSTEEITTPSAVLTDVYNGGYYTDAVFKITGTSSNGFTLYSDREPDKVLNVKAAMSGATVIIDTTDMSVKMNGVSILHKCEGDFFELHPQHNIITISPDNGSLSFTVTYRERYL